VKNNKPKDHDSDTTMIATDANNTWWCLAVVCAPYIQKH